MTTNDCRQLSAATATAIIRKLRDAELSATNRRCSWCGDVGSFSHEPECRVLERILTLREAFPTICEQEGLAEPLSEPCPTEREIALKRFMQDSRFHSLCTTLINLCRGARMTAADIHQAAAVLDRLPDIGAERHACGCQVGLPHVEKCPKVQMALMLDGEFFQDALGNVVEPDATTIQVIDDPESVARGIELGFGLAEFSIEKNIRRYNKAVIATAETALLLGPPSFKDFWIIDDGADDGADKPLIVETKFVECPSCAAKPGTPLLCAECLRRRAAIEGTNGDRR